MNLDYDDWELPNDWSGYDTAEEYFEDLAKMSGNSAEGVRVRLAEVKRDAAREALDGLAAHEADMYLTRCQREDYRGAAWCEHARQAAEECRDTHYPEGETP